MTNDIEKHDAALTALYAARQLSISPMSASATDHTNSYQRSDMRDGQVVVTSAGAVSRTSNEAITSEANLAARVPYIRAVNALGNHVAPHEVTDETRITLPNIGEVTVAQAKAHGFLPHNWSATGPNLLEQARKERTRQEAMDTPFTQNDAPIPETHPDLEAQTFADPAVEQNLTELVNNVAGTDQMEAIRGIVETGEIDQQTLARAASQLRTEPEALMERLGPVRAAYEAQAREVMGQGGVPADDVIAYGQTHARDALNRAMYKQATGRSTSGYAALRQSYLASLGDLYPDRALAADLGNGLKAHKGPKGDVRVNVPGIGEMSWRSAIEAFGPKS